MNIQLSGLGGGYNPYGQMRSSMNGAPSNTLELLQTLLNMMMQLMSNMGTGAPGNSQNLGLGPQNPSFGCGCGGAPQSAGMGIPGLGYLSGQGNPNEFGSSPASNSSNDSYVPAGSDSHAPIGDLGNGSGANAVQWALSKEGISETNNPAAVRAISRGRWQPWCADFVSQAYANSPGGSPFGHKSSVAGILKWGRERNKFFSAGAAQGNPKMLKPGDIAVWKSNGKSHVGLVTGMNANGTFNTIEGNASDAVRRRTHSFGKGLTGFVRPRG